jgi:hypothetical protein
VVPLRLASNSLWAARCHRGCLVLHVAGGALVWRDDLVDVVGGDLVLHVGEEEDRVSELQLFGAVLWGMRENCQQTKT